MTAIIRTFALIAAAVAGFFVLAASAAFAFFVLIGLIILGLIGFVVMWVRMRVFGRRRFAQARHNAEQTFRQFNEAARGHDGPVLDAQKTPDGWSVEDRE